MGDQPTSEWSTEKIADDYFIRQLANPYQSTIEFFSFINNYHTLSGSTIVDACCGSGCNSFYLADNYTPKKIYSFDLSDHYLDMAEAEKQKRYQGVGTELVFTHADIYNITKDHIGSPELDKIDGVIIMQTLSWLTNHKEALAQVANLDSDWIAISSLFYEGLIEAEISIRCHDLDGGEKSVFPYNVYSIPIIENYLQSLGFGSFAWKKFVIKTPLTQPINRDVMGTYTVELSDGDLLQMSGPITMPWYFLIATRNKQT